MVRCCRRPRRIGPRRVPSSPASRRELECRPSAATTRSALIDDGNPADDDSDTRPFPRQRARCSGYRCTPTSRARCHIADDNATLRMPSPPAVRQRRRRRGPVLVDVTNAGDAVCAPGIHQGQDAQGLEARQSPRHDALATGLVDGRPPAFDEHHVEAAHPRFDGQAEAGWTAAEHAQVTGDHGATAARRTLATARNNAARTSASPSRSGVAFAGVSVPARNRRSASPRRSLPLDVLGKVSGARR